MRVKVQCTNPPCGKHFTVEDNLVGKTAKCKQCGVPFKLIAIPDASVADGPAPVEAKTAVRTMTASDGAASDGAASNGTRPEAVTAGPSATRPTVGGLERLARFEIRQRLGAGAFGTVYRAYDPQLEREIALKIPQPGIMDSPKRVERFLREAKSAAQLRHPNIVPIYDAGQEQGHYYIASAFIDGKPLADAVEEKGIDLRRAADIVRKLAESLDYAHDLGIVHRDIKPANIMLDTHDEPHIMDFGLAARADTTEKLTQDGAVLGTPAYMAPEQAQGQQGDAQPASDQYSLGIVLYELLCGRTPFEGPPQIVLYHAINTEPPAPRTLRKDIPPDLENICQKAMAKNAGDRYANCFALAADLRRWLEGEPVLARRPGFGERVVRWAKREPKLAMAGALALAGLVALAAGLGLLARQLYGDVAEEIAAHGKTRQELEVEKVSHKATKGDLYVSQISLAADELNEDLDDALTRLDQTDADFRGWEWRHLHARARGADAAVRILKHNSYFVRLAFTADSRHLLSNHNSGEKAAWAMATGHRAKNEALPIPIDFTPHAFTPDGKLVATAQPNMAMPVPPVAPAAILAALGALADPLNMPVLQAAAAFRAPLHYTPIAWFPPPPQPIVVWDAALGKKLHEWKIPGGGQSVLAFHPEGAKLAIASGAFMKPMRLALYDVQTGKEEQEIAADIENIQALEFSPDGAHLAILIGGGFTTVTKEVVKTIMVERNGEQVPQTVTFQVQECKVDGNSGSEVRVVTLATSEVVTVPRKLAGPGVIRFDANGRLFIGGPDGLTMHAVNGKELLAFHGSAGPITVVAFSPDGMRVATAVSNSACAMDGLVKIWDGVSGKFLVALKAPLPDAAITQLLFSPDGKHLAALRSRQHEAVVFSAVDSRLIYPYLEHGGAVTSVAWSADDKLLASYSSCDQLSKVWDSDAGKTRLSAQPMPQMGLGFATGNEWLYSKAGCLGGLVSSGCLGFHGGAGIHGGYGAHGGFGAYGGHGHGYGPAPEMRVYERDGFTPRLAPKGFEKIMAVRPDGSRWVVMPPRPKGPVAVEDEPNPRLWDVAADKELFEFDPPGFSPKAQFTDDGKRVLITSTAMAETTGYLYEFVIEQRTRTVMREKDGKKYPAEETYTVQIPKSKTYKRSVLAGHLKLYDVVSGRVQYQIGGVDHTLAMSGSGKWIATLPPPEPMPFGQPNAPRPMVKPQPAPPSKAELVAPDGSVAIVAQEPNPAFVQPMPPVMPRLPTPPITLWDTEGKAEPRWQLAVSTRPCGMGFSPDAKFFMAWFPPGESEYKETRTAQKPDGQAYQYEVTVKKLDPQRLIVWSTETGREVFTHRGATGPALFSPDSKRLASAAGPLQPMNIPAPYGAPMIMPALPAPKIGKNVTEASPYQVASAAQGLPVPQPFAEPPLAAPGGQVVQGEYDAGFTIHVFDMTTLRPQYVLTGHTSPISALTFSADSTLLASANFGHRGQPAAANRATIRIWTMTDGKERLAIVGHSGRVNCLAFDSPANRLASASDDGTVKVWNVADLPPPAPDGGLPAIHETLRGP